MLYDEGTNQPLASPWSPCGEEITMAMKPPHLSLISMVSCPLSRGMNYEPLDCRSDSNIEIQSFSALEMCAHTLPCIIRNWNSETRAFHGFLQLRHSASLFSSSCHSTATSQPSVVLSCSVATLAIPAITETSNIRRDGSLFLASKWPFGLMIEGIVTIYS